MASLSDHEVMKSMVVLPSLEIFKEIDQQVKVDRTWGVKVVFVPKCQNVLFRGQDLVEGVLKSDEKRSQSATEFFLP